MFIPCDKPIKQHWTKICDFYFFLSGDKAPTQNISSWLQCHGRGKIMDHKIFGHIPYDIYVIGTQESAMTEKEWVNFIKKQITQCGFAEIEVVGVVEF